MAELSCYGTIQVKEVTNFILILLIIIGCYSYAVDARGQDAKWIVMSDSKRMIPRDIKKAWNDKGLNFEIFTADGGKTGIVSVIDTTTKQIVAVVSITTVTNFYTAEWVVYDVKTEEMVVACWEPTEKCERTVTEMIEVYLSYTVEVEVTVEDPEAPVEEDKTCKEQASKYQEVYNQERHAEQLEQDNLDNIQSFRMQEEIYARAVLDPAAAALSRCDASAGGGGNPFLPIIK